ncbi:flavin-containing amine oxidase, partial [Phaeodactylum tricornutum CCAP 1055/1]
MSGLSCARELQHRGYHVLVVEARQRVGGRLKGTALQLPTGEQQVDLGGALIHGIDDNPVAELVDQIGVRTRPVSDTLLLDKTGWPLDLREDERISHLFNECLEEAFERTRGKQSDTSFGDLFNTVCEGKAVNTSAILRWHKANLEVSCGTSFEKLGWQWNEDEAYGFDGDHVALQASWKPVVEALAEPLDIVYNASVELIHLTGPRNTVVQITLMDGTVLEADSVVCTVPLGILKRKTISFDPPLPTPKQQAIERLGIGLLNKCTLSFPHVFWQDSDFLGLAEDEHSYLVLNGATFTDNPVLLFMFGGEFAHEIEKWTDTEIVTDCLRILSRICGCQVPEPTDYHTTRWGREQYSRMAFTFIPPGVDGAAELRAMGEPVLNSIGNVPALMFAGEHTTFFHPSTIHGAFFSGIREAYRL